MYAGLLTSAVMEFLSHGMEPVVHTTLESLLSPMLPSLNSVTSPFGPPPVFIPIASQVITGFILSPLHLIRTRLIVQSSSSRYRTYSGPLDALRQILEHEGGLSGIYLHPHLLFPTIIDCTLRSVVPLTFPPLIASYLSISTEANPVTRNVTGLLGTCIGLLVTMPFETVRRRLQVQARGTAKPLKGCVELRPAPYNGMVDAFWHILTEERSDLPLKHRRHRRKSVIARSKTGEAGEPQLQDGHSESWLKNTGIGQLYRGLGMRLSATVIVLVLAMLSVKDESETGWAEL